MKLLKKRWLRIAFMLQVIAVLFNTSLSELLITDSIAQTCDSNNPCTDGMTCVARTCVPAPELPLEFLPLLLVLMGTGFYFIRRRHMLALA